MEERFRNQYLRRSQKDYSMTFKLQVVSEIERGELSVTGARKKYGIQGSHTVTVWLQNYAFGLFLSKSAVWLDCYSE